MNNGKSDVGKFDEKSDKRIFFGYTSNVRAYRVFNKRTLVVKESPHVIFDKSSSKLTLFNEYDATAANEKENLQERPKSSQPGEIPKDNMDPTSTLEKEDPTLADLQDKVDDDPELPKDGTS